MIEKLVACLRRAGFEPAASEVADLLWLWRAMSEDLAAARPTLGAEPEGADRPPRQTWKPNRIDGSLPSANRLGDRSYRKSVASTEQPGPASVFEQADIHAQSLSGKETEEDGALPIPMPAPPALPHALAITRALRFLRGRQPRGDALEVDEEETVHRIAIQRFHVPRLSSYVLQLAWRPVSAPWLDLALVVDGARTMAFWWQSTIQFRLALSRVGVFRRIRTYTAVTDEEHDVPMLREGMTWNRRAKPCGVRQLVAASGRCLVMVLTDAVSPGWWDGRMARLLGQIGKHNSLALIHMLPSQMWTGTVLGRTARMIVQQRRDHCPASALKVTRRIYEPNSDPDSNGITIPLASLHAASLRVLARFLSMPFVGSLATLLPLQSLEADPSNDDGSLAVASSAEELVDEFYVAASQGAQRLGRALADVPGPYTFPIVRLVRAALFPNGNHWQVAEVLLAGLLEQVGGDGVNDPELFIFDFRFGVREALTAAAPQDEPAQSFAEMSRYLEQNLGRLQEFTGWALARGATESTRLAKGSTPFAKMLLSKLLEMGGQRAELAHRLRPRLLRASLHPTQPSEFESHHHRHAQDSLSVDDELKGFEHSGSGDDVWDPPTRFRDGSMIISRYRLARVLGRGSFGEVWAAHDTATGRAVAVKLLSDNAEMGHARAQLEVAALRRSLPGVVELLDDGVDDGQAFLVMELVEGLPFPGVPLPGRWEEIAPVAVSLLETLARIHSAFVIHRDLKPSNVLVTRDNRVRLLDFGAAYRVTAGADNSVENFELLGTPAYMAPEQVRRQPISERTDLFSLGVMLYEALSGQLPNPGASIGEVMRARITRPPVPLLEVTEDAPPNVAKLVERMISADPAKRPASAFEVLATLRGENSVERADLSWLGSRATFNMVVLAVREGRSVDLVGPRGSGRTRWLRALVGVLSSSHRVHWVQATATQEVASTPFQSLEGFMKAAGETVDEPIGNRRPLATNDVEARLRTVLEGGDVILADDFARLDAASQEVLDRVRLVGVVVRAVEIAQPGVGMAVQIAPLTEGDLRSLFAGPDRLLHLREDAARLLYQRTAGSPAKVVSEVDSWLALGFARRSRNLLVVSRDGLDRLAAGAISALDDYAVTLDENRGRAAHAAAANALPAGSDGRLLHLVLAAPSGPESDVAIARESAALATRLLNEGRLGAAVTAIDTGLRAARGAGTRARMEKSALFGLWAECAFEEGVPSAVDPLLHALYRAEYWPEKEAVETLVRSMKVEEFASSRAMDLANSILPQRDPRLERLRICVLMKAARLRLDPVAEEKLLDQLSSSPLAADPEIAPRIDSARGRLRYEQGRFLEAAALQERAARSGSPLHQIAARNAGAWALLEAFELDRAVALASEAHALAASFRHASHEAAAAWTLRAIAYRKRIAGPPDLELVAAAQLAASRQWQGSILMTEAAAAYRAGHPEARTLARRGHDLFSAINQPRGALLMRCLCVALGDSWEDAEVRVLIEKALSYRGSGIGLEALGLLAIGGCHSTGEIGADLLTALANEIPRAHWDTPIDVLCVNEALDAIDAARTA